MTISDSVFHRYTRNFKTFTENDQKMVQRSKVTVTGLGGLGGAVLEMLARTGVGNLKGIDNDVFDVTNLNRQLFCNENLIGESKAVAALNRIKSINSNISINCVNEFLTEDNAVSLVNGSDLIIDCLDSIKTRFILESAAKELKIPLVTGAIAGTSGQVSVIFPEDKGFELIYGKKGKKNSQGIENKLGNLSFSAFFIASVQVSECIKIILKKKNILRNKLLIVDLFSNVFEIIKLQ